MAQSINQPFAIDFQLASVHPETLSFWNRWFNRDFWGRKARRFP
jgi:hypothetical protein